MDFPKTTAELVRLVRCEVLGQSQAEFGLSVGRTQAVVSKYESGSTEVPGDVVMHCVNTMQLKLAVQRPPTEAELIGAVKRTLSGKKKASLRRALFALLQEL